MKREILALLFVCLCQRVALGSWLAESKPNQGDSLCPKGQVLAGVIFKDVEESSSSSSSSSSSNSSSSQSSGPGGSSSSASNSQALSQSSSVSTFKKVQIRAFCQNLDGTNAVRTNGSSKGGSAGESRKSWTLQEGCKVDDKDKNCPDGSFISGIKLAGSGDSPSITVVCSKDDQYELDDSIEARMIGPIKFQKGQPAQAQNPAKANDNGKCQVDAAVALGCDDSGITIKVASFKKKGKQYDSSCKQKKEKAAQEANSHSSSNSTSSSSSSMNQTSSSSSNSSSTETRSSNSSTVEKSRRSNHSKSSGEDDAGDDQPCVCVCNQVCRSGGKDKSSGEKDKKSGKDDKSGGKSKDKSKGKSGGKSKGKDGKSGGKSKGGKSGDKKDNPGKGHHMVKREAHGSHGKGHGWGHRHHKHGKGSEESESSSSSSSSSTKTESRSESSQSSSSFSKSSSSSSSSSSSYSESETKTETLEYKESTYEGKSVYIVSNEKKLKRCPESQCHCPCVCKGGKRSGGGSGGGKGSKSKGSKSKGKDASKGKGSKGKGSKGKGSKESKNKSNKGGKSK